MCLDNTSLAGTPVNKEVLEDLVKCGVFLFFLFFVYIETPGSESERNRFAEFILPEFVKKVLEVQKILYLCNIVWILCNP